LTNQSLKASNKLQVRTFVHLNTDDREESYLWKFLREVLLKIMQVGPH